MAATQTAYEPERSPINAPEIFQLRNDECGREAVRLMNERFSGNNNVVLDISDLAENEPIGNSNIYRMFALGPIVRESYDNDMRLISPIISEIALRNGRLSDAASKYNDLGVVVYNLSGPNRELATHLYARRIEIDKKLKLPAVFYGLKTVKDDKFPDGLRLDLDDIATAYHVPILSKGESKLDSNNQGLVVTGFPSQVGEGNRILYAGKSGLRRFYRDEELSLDAGLENLSESNKNSQISFIKIVPSDDLETAFSMFMDYRRMLDNN